ncbi:MAG: efflux RND transporter periplasmic adaptor subunit, partial [Eubacteriales bacterium]|nr:efflux RND transporter periplasmic adaptor subunit [Eubacteriales bacterium]
SGKTYDLSELKALLEQEPTDTDAAEELKEKLEEWQETVQLQYEELLRNQKAEKLKIEYTYETTVLEGQLAEVTYLETTSELEETLQAAKDALSDAEDIKEQLEAMTGGILTAEQSGYVASVAYEEGDTFYPTADILTFYDTSDVTLSIEVPQENIAEIAVGDAVSVDLGQYGTYEGRITEKMLEASEGNSRTEVTYAVTITAENTQGRLSAGISAEIEIETNADQEEKGDE